MPLRYRHNTNFVKHTSSQYRSFTQQDPASPKRPRRSTFSIEGDLLAGAAFHPSPFCDERPANTVVSLLIIHSISLPEGDFGTDYVRQLFMGELVAGTPCGDLAGVRVSCHLFVRRDGEILQFVPFAKRAWHAGRSSFDGAADCNDYSIGVELEGTDSTPFAPAQYASLIGVTHALLARFPALNPKRITGHSDVALPQGRKSDPGKGMDWHLYLSALSSSSIQKAT